MKKGEGFLKGFLLKNSKLNIILIYDLITLVVMFVFYPIIPIIMGYFPNFREISAKAGAGFDFQYLSICLLTIILGTFFLALAFRGIGKWSKMNDEDNSLQIDNIRKKSINLPHVIFIFQISFISLLVLVAEIIVSTITKAPVIMALKIFTVVFSIVSVAGVLSYIFAKQIFTKILLQTYKGQGLQGIRIGISKKIFLQIIPLFIVAILFTSMLGISRLMEEKGNLVYKICKIQIEQVFMGKTEFKSEDELYKTLKKIIVNDAQIGYFIVSRKDGSMTTSDGYKPGLYFKYFANNPTQGDRVYGDATDIQGVVKSVKINGQDYFAGVRFVNTSNRTVNFFLISLIALLALNVLVLYFFSKALTNEISLVAGSLDEIAKGESVDLDKKIAVTSNDEIGDLVVAFNKIQEREKEHIKEVENKQSILMEQERLASLGNLIGGIAHNLRTPIMSIAGGIEGLKDLIKEYDDAIEDMEVNKEDHHEIAKEMNIWIKKMGPYCSYMDEIITAVKGQTVQYIDDSNDSFTLDEVRKRVEILIDHELKIRHCKLKVDFKADKNTKINGEISVLIQVLNNLIVNAAQSYIKKGGEIELSVIESEKVVEFIVKDYGCGISPKVRGKLFKEMITTKGNKGTGLGLYMSYSNIKARFGGRMRFESEEGKGTTFYIYIPY